MERLHNPKSYQNINQKYAGDIKTADFKYSGVYIAGTKQKSDCQKQYRKSAKIYAVDNGRRGHYWQKIKK